MPSASTGAAARSTVRALWRKGGIADRSEPDGSRQTGVEAPSCGRPGGHAARRDVVGRQPARQHDAGADPGRRSRRTARARSTASSPRQAARRQRLRPQALSSGMPSPLGHTPHCPARRRKQPEAWAPSLGGGADLRLARPLPPPCRPLRTPRRHPHGLPQTRLRSRLPQPDQTVLLGPLRPPGRYGQSRSSAGTVPPLAASLVITCRCSQVFIAAESS